MIIVDCQQGTPEWHTARLGIPTASRFDDILTPTGKPSASAAGYMDELLAEWLAGQPVDQIEATSWMARGTELEASARAGYEFDTGNTVQQVGFIVRDDGLVGCSPDGLVGDDGGVEIKNPKASTMVGYYRNGGLPTRYIPQVQGCLWITGRAWWDFYASHPALPPLRVRVVRDDTYISALSIAVDRFIGRMMEERENLDGMGWRVK